LAKVIIYFRFVVFSYINDKKQLFKKEERVQKIEIIKERTGNRVEVVFALSTL